MILLTPARKDVLLYHTASLSFYKAVEQVWSMDRHEDVTKAEGMECVFPSDAELEELLARDEILPWKELPVHKWYCVELMTEIHTKYGDTKVLDMHDRDGNRWKVWSPASIREKLEARILPVYVKPRGLEVSQKDSTRRYYAVDII